MTGAVDQYVAALEPEVAETARRIRATLLAAVPEATETCRYQMPAVMFGDRYGLHFGMWKKHVGLYPVGELPEPLASEVAPYRTKVDTVAFQYRDGVPYELIGRIAAALAERRRE